MCGICISHSRYIMTLTFYVKHIYFWKYIFLKVKHKHGWEELPHVRGQGQNLGGPHALRVAAKRSYPTSEVRCSGWECQAATAQEWPRGATPRLRSGRAAERSYPESEVRGGYERSYPTPQARGQGQQPGGPTPRPRSRGCVGAGWPRGAIPRWRSGRAAVRRYPSSKVRSSDCTLLEQPWRDNPRPRWEKPK